LNYFCLDIFQICLCKKQHLPTLRQNLLSNKLNDVRKKLNKKKIQGIFNEPQSTHDDDDVESTPYKAIYDFSPEAPGEVGFSEGDIVYIFSKDVGDGWWRGEVNGVEGIMPSSYLQKI